MKIIFAGTPHFAAVALAELLKEHEVLVALTQPDRPSGRGMQVTPSPVKKLAEQHGVPVMQPTTLKSEEVQNKLASFNADVMIVAAYGLILPKAVLAITKYGCLNIHASNLPRWRGAAPIQRAILEGDKETGITIMQMDEGLDTGDILLKKMCTITEDDTAQMLHDKLAELGTQGIIETLQLLRKNQLHPERQDERFATYANKLSKSEAQIDWTKPAKIIDCAVRAYFPFPIASSLIHDTQIKILRASCKENFLSSKASGTVISIDKENIVVACGQGTLNLKILQKPGGKALPVAQFIQSFPIKPGDVFGVN